MKKNIKVTEYEKAGEKFRAAWAAVQKLQDEPEVKAYLDAKEKAAKPVKSDQEKRQEELNELYDQFFVDWMFVHRFNFILAELAHKETDASIEDISGMVAEIDNRLWAMHEGAARFFELQGIVKDASEYAVERLKKEREKKTEQKAA